MANRFGDPIASWDNVFRDAWDAFEKTEEYKEIDQRLTEAKKARMREMEEDETPKKGESE